MGSAMVAQGSFDSAMVASAKAGKGGAGFRSAVSRLEQELIETRKGARVKLSGNAEDIEMVLNTVQRMESEIAKLAKSEPATSPVKRAAQRALKVENENANAVPAKRSTRKSTAKSEAPTKPARKSTAKSEAPTKPARKSTPRAERTPRNKLGIVQTYYCECGNTAEASQKSYNAGWRLPGGVPHCAVCAIERKQGVPYSRKRVREPQTGNTEPAMLAKRASRARTVKVAARA